MSPKARPLPGAPKAPLGSRLLWFAGLTLAGTGLTAVVAYGLRWLLRLG